MEKITNKQKTILASFIKASMRKDKAQEEYTSADRDLKQAESKIIDIYVRIRSENTWVANPMIIMLDGESYFIEIDYLEKTSKVRAIKLPEPIEC